MDLENMKVADLKDELKARGLSLLGKKNELVERLRQAIILDDLLGPSTDNLKEVRTKEEIKTAQVEAAPVAQKIETNKTTVIDQKEARMKRFGLETTTEKESKKIERAKRFGIDVSSTDTNELKRKRAERFNIKTDEDRNNEIELRKKRFGIADSQPTDDLRRKRIERFGKIL